MNYFKRSSLVNLSNFKTRIGKPNINFKSISANKIFLIIFLLLLGFGIFYWVSTINSAVKGVSAPTINKIVIAPPRAEHNINQEFSFSLRDQKGAEVSKLKFFVEKAELRDEIIVKGERASSTQDKVFLVINLKIVNDFNKSVQINTRDYIRLIANNNDKELLAPEIHNDPVEVQATSTKYTKVGYAINESDKNLKLRVGEIDKDKTTIELKF